MSKAVQVAPAIMRWARQRSGRGLNDLASRFPKIRHWEDGSQLPTFQELRKFAHETHTPFGYFFLDAPPEEKISIPDLRTIGGLEITTPSPELRDTIYLCEQRQAWFREYELRNNAEPLTFVHSLSVSETSPQDGVEAIRSTLNLPASSAKISSEDLFRSLRHCAEEAGILVMVSGVVGSNTQRPLNPNEFRGFAIVDDIAPLVFINSKDTTSARSFSLAHELAHIWIGQSGISSLDYHHNSHTNLESLCNSMAAELLVPHERFTSEFKQNQSLDTEITRLAKVFKVSTLVILRCLRDREFLSDSDYWSNFHSERDRLLTAIANKPKSSGGNPYTTQIHRLGSKFTRSIIGDVLEGQTSYTEAFHLLSINSSSVFNELANRLDVI